MKRASSSGAAKGQSRPAAAPRRCAADSLIRGQDGVLPSPGKVASPRVAHRCDHSRSSISAPCRPRRMMAASPRRSSAVLTLNNKSDRSGRLDRLCLEPPLVPVGRSDTDRRQASSNAEPVRKPRTLAHRCRRGDVLLHCLVAVPPRPAGIIRRSMTAAEVQDAIVRGATLGGEFWIAQTTTRSAGTLVWSFEKGAVLELIGHTRGWPTDLGQFHHTVHGVLEGTVEITLFDAGVRSMTAVNSPTTLGGFTLVSGANTTPATKWRRVVFETANLGGWVRDTGRVPHYSAPGVRDGVVRSPPCVRTQPAARCFPARYGDGRDA